jgi:hypothetical protein
MTDTNPNSATVTDIRRASPAAIKRAGQRWETAIQNGLRSAGLDAERLRLNGADDEGDLAVRLNRWSTALGAERIVIEAKAGKLHAATFVDQAIREADAYARHRRINRRAVMGIAVVKRPRKSWSDAFVLTSLREYFRLADEDTDYPAGGRSWARTLCQGLRFAGKDVELVAYNQHAPEGDLVVHEQGQFRLIVAHNGDLHLPELIDRTHAETAVWSSHRKADLRRVDGITVVRRRNKGWGDAYVITTVADFFGLSEYDADEAEVYGLEAA